jgi:acetyl-CoA acetyltransferase
MAKQMRNTFEDVRIVGVSTTEQARDLSPRNGFDLGLEALRLALADAGLEVNDIDGLASRISGWPYDTLSFRSEASNWAWQLKRPLHWSSSDATINAMLEAAGAITAGLCSTVAIILGQAVDRDPRKTAPWTRPETEFTGWTGSYTTVQYALVAQRYLHDVGEHVLDAFGEAAAVIRNFGSINPDAVYFQRGPFTKGDILSSRPIASPLTMLMCSSVNDGGCGVVMTHKNNVKDPTRAIRIVAGAQQHSFPSYVEPPMPKDVGDEAKYFAQRMAAEGIRHEDIDVVEFYDNFASEVVIELERYGFCQRGEGASLVLDGQTRLNGKYPTCTDGGLMSFSHNGPPALFRPIEAVRQLRGEVKDLCLDWDEVTHTHEDGVCRLVPDVELAFASNPSAPTGGGSYIVLARA